MGARVRIRAWTAGVHDKAVTVLVLATSRLNNISTGNPSGFSPSASVNAGFSVPRGARLKDLPTMSRDIADRARGGT